MADVLLALITMLGVTGVILYIRIPVVFLSPLQEITLKLVKEAIEKGTYKFDTYKVKTASGKVKDSIEEVVINLSKGATVRFYNSYKRHKAFEIYNREFSKYVDASEASSKELTILLSNFLDLKTQEQREEYIKNYQKVVKDQKAQAFKDILNTKKDDVIKILKEIEQC